MSNLIQCLPWQVRQDDQGWSIGQPAVINGASIWVEVARITSNPEYAETVAQMLVKAVNAYRAQEPSVEEVRAELAPEIPESCPWCKTDRKQYAEPPVIRHPREVGALLCTTCNRSWKPAAMAALARTRTDEEDGTR